MNKSCGNTNVMGNPILEFMRKQIESFVYFVVLFLLAISCNSNKSSNSNTPEIIKADTSHFADSTKSWKNTEVKNDTIEVTAVKLTSDYVANEIKADNDYKNKVLSVTGAIEDIKRGITDNIFVVLTGSEKFRAVQCYFNDEKAAQKLIKGMKVNFVGKCDGLMANVVLKDCQLLENSK